MLVTELQQLGTITSAMIHADMCVHKVYFTFKQSLLNLLSLTDTTDFISKLS